MKSFCLWVLSLALICHSENILAQNTIAFQGFEGTTADNWGFTSPTQAAGPGQVIVGRGNYGAGYAKTGSFSMRAGGGSTTCGSGSGNCINGAATGGSCNNLPNGKIVQFNTVDVACLSGIQISVSHRCHVLCGGQGQGLDAGENLWFEVNLNGAGWTTVGTLGGSSNYIWLYTTNPAGGASTVANPFVYNVPAGTQTVAFRTNCNVNRSDEVYYIDDVKITTTTVGYNFPGTAGIWNGIVNTDWTNKCNWDDRIVPVTTTDVIIPNAAVNICEVLPALTGNCHNLIIDKSKLAVEYFTSTLNVTGNLTIDNNGLLDMSLFGNEGGTLNLSGNWLNKRDETYFDEGRSKVNFIGNANQTISVSNDTKESYFKIGINNSTGNVVANTDIWLDKLIAGGTANMLTLSNSLFDLNTHTLTIWNPNPTAISRTAGGIVSEKTNNSSRILWKMNSSTGNYIYPFIRTDGVYIPFTFNHTTGNAGDVTLATYGTPPANLPWPTIPDLVTNLASATGLLPDNRDATVDRFWQIDVSGSATADLTFTYAPGELPLAPYNNPNTMQAQRYSVASNQWLTYLPGQTAGANFVTVPNVSTFSPWTITNTSSPLPIELLNFSAVQMENNVEVSWTTVSEINNDYFTLLRSHDGVHFEEIARIDGAGNSTIILDYNYTDTKPLDGISYYRLRQTDYDGEFSFSKIVAVNINSATASCSIDLLYIDQATHELAAFITAPEPGPLLVELMDAMGRLVFSKCLIPEAKVVYMNLNSSGFNPGIYLFRISDGRNERTRKVLID